MAGQCYAIAAIIVTVLLAEITTAKFAKAKPATVLPCDQTLIPEKDVINHIFINYSKSSRPRLNSSQIVDVNIALRISSIVNFVEKQNLLAISGYVYLDWYDEALIWDTKYPYYCVEHLLLSKSDVWTPDLLFQNSDDMHSLVVSPGSKVWLQSDGFIQFTPHYQMGIKCEPDLTLFPFDTQICNINIASSNYPNKLQHLRFTNNNNNEGAFAKLEDSFTKSKQWEIVGNRSRIVTHNVGELVYDTAIFTLVLSRQPQFYFLNVILPSLIITIAELVTFVLPIEEVVRVLISFTCLLAYSVFQTMVLSDMPRSSNCAPLLSLYIDLQMAFIAFIAILGECVVFFFIYRANLRNTKPSSFVFYSFQWFGRLLLVEYHFNLINSTTAAILMMANLPGEEDALRKSIAASIGTPTGAPPSSSAPRRRSMKYFADETLREIRYQWLYMAEVVERFNMLLYFIAILVTPTIMFTILPPKKIELIM